MNKVIAAHEDFFHSAFATEKPSDEWFSARDISEKYGLTVPSAQARLNTQVAHGNMETKAFNVVLNGVRRRVNYYRLKT
jgi:hypothetical protein